MLKKDNAGFENVVALLVVVLLLLLLLEFVISRFEEDGERRDDGRWDGRRVDGNATRSCEEQAWKITGPVKQSG